MYKIGDKITPINHPMEGHIGEIHRIVGTFPHCEYVVFFEEESGAYYFHPKEISLLEGEIERVILWKVKGNKKLFSNYEEAKKFWSSSLNKKDGPTSFKKAKYSH